MTLIGYAIVDVLPITYSAYFLVTQVNYARSLAGINNVQGGFSLKLFCTCVPFYICRTVTMVMFGCGCLTSSLFLLRLSLVENVGLK